MTAEQENWLSMFKTTDARCTQNLTAITAIPILSAVYTRFKNDVVALKELVRIQIKQIDGVAVHKNALKKQLADAGGVVAGILVGYFAHLDNTDLMHQMMITPSDLLNSRDDAIEEYCLNIQAVATANMPGAADAGLSVAIMDAFNDAITKYQANVSTPTIAIGERTVATNEMSTLFSTINTLLDNLDRLMLSFSVTDPHFYRLYKKARMIIDHAGGRPAQYGTIKGIVKDSVSGLVLEDVLVEILENELAMTTSALGEYSLNTEPGTYSIRASLDGYTETEMTGLVVVKGEDLSVNILLEPMV
ncbi:MAG: carboxypeptidase-like regulatory domain-containing protein [Chitinophagales bacterium]